MQSNYGRTAADKSIDKCGKGGGRRTPVPRLLIIRKQPPLRLTLPVPIGIAVLCSVE
jgi:hypothetical protein